VATALVTGLATTHVDVHYGVRLLPAIALLYVFRRHYAGAGLRAWSWTAVVAGFLAGVVFVALAPRPLDEARLSWHDQWEALPAWGRVAWVMVRSLGAVVVVPVVEELAFRGYLLRRLVSREFETVSFAHFSWTALLVSSAAFGGIHHGWLGGTLAGLLFAAVQIRGNGVGHAIAAHVAANAVVTFCALGLGWWWLWA
jgi:CAAX prenyl protease-like protein